MGTDVFSLDGRIILVTGAFGLIGSRICRTFLDRGASVILAGHDARRAEAVREETGEAHPQSRFRVSTVEITDPKSVARCVSDCVEAFGRLDVLVNNAAIDAKFDPAHAAELDAHGFENYPLEKFRKSVDVNVLGTVAATQAALRVMLPKGGGNVINVASVYSEISPNPALYEDGSGNARQKPADYVATKSFIPNFTRYVAATYARRNIRCNAIAPHGVFHGHDGPFLRNFEKLSPMGRMARLDEMDGPFVFLASQASSYVTGITLLVDGGWSAW